MTNEPLNEHITESLTVEGADLITDLLSIRAGAQPAYVDVGNIPARLRWTARELGTGGNTITVRYIDPGANNIPLAVDVTGDTIEVTLETDGTGVVVTTGLDVIAEVAATPAADALVVVTLVPDLPELVGDEGNDGSGIVSEIDAFTATSLAGGLPAQVVMSLTARGVLNLHSLSPVIGERMFNVFDEAGIVVMHFDDDGGLQFASERFGVSQAGDVIINMTTFGQPLAGNPIFECKVNDAAVFSVQPGAGFNMVVSQRAAADVALTVDAFTAQTADIMDMHDESYVLGARFDKRGGFITGVTSAPADAALAASQLAFWFDDTNGAAKLKLKGKSADGTVVVGEVALT